MKKIYLLYRKAEKVDMNNFYKKYDKSGKNPYNMAYGTPVLIRIEGTVTYMNDLPFLCKNKDDSFYVKKWLENEKFECFFCWARDKDGRVL